MTAKLTSRRLFKCHRTYAFSFFIYICFIHTNIIELNEIEGHLLCSRVDLWKQTSLLLIASTILIFSVCLKSKVMYFLILDFIF
jgi:hypothetical protein